MKFSLISLSFLLLCCLRSASAAHEGVTLGALLTRTTVYSILIDLLTFSDLLETVSEAKNITIFAPVNFAFRETAIELGCTDTMTNAAVTDCYKALGKSTVAAVLQYHVVPALLPSEDVLATTTFTTLLGQTFERRGTRLMDASDEFTNPMLLVPQLDQRYQYGYVHGISRVLMPDLTMNKQPNVIQVLTDAGVFKTLLFLIDYAGLKKNLRNMKDITVFAPTDRAFMFTAKDVGCEDVSTMAAVNDCFTTSFTPEQIAFGLTYHITSGVRTTSDLPSMGPLLMANGQYVYKRGPVLVDQVPFTTNPVLAAKFQNVAFDGGIAHAIIRALNPFRDLITSPKICRTFEFPISLADSSFLPLFKIVIAARKCEAVRDAINECELMQSQICKNFRGEKFIGFGLSTGRVVAAAKNCMEVVTALSLCPQAM